MNILELKIKQATSGEKERKSVIEIPGCNERECRNTEFTIS
jgi:putative membrane protein